MPELLKPCCVDIHTSDRDIWSIDIITSMLDLLSETDKEILMAAVAGYSKPVKIKTEVINDMIYLFGYLYFREFYGDSELFENDEELLDCIYRKMRCNNINIKGLL